MNTQEIIEGNKLIAEFMGATSFKHGIFDAVNFPEKTEEGFKSYDLIYLKYHSSWDWLMPVVEKIEQTKQADIIIHAKNLVQISYNKETKTYFSGSLLEDVWSACTEFVKWYNQNN